MRTTLLILVLGAVAACQRPPDRAQPPTPARLPLPAWARADTALRVDMPYDNPLTEEGIALGRLLFHDKALSNDGSLSCASCHLQAHAFSDPRPRSVGMEGTAGARNAPTIQNVAWDHFFFWDARALSIELQAFEPVRGHAEMRSTWPEVYARLQRDARYSPLFKAAFGDAAIDSMRIAFAIAQFERTLVSLNAKYDRVLHGKERFTSEEQRGRDLFFGSAHCVDCHEPPLFRSHAVANIGLDSVPIDPGMGGRTRIAWHAGRFKTPTLRNVAVSAPYMHDGRFNTLEQVVDFYADDVQVNASTLDAHMQPWVKGEVRLSAQDRADLVAFLKTLTDEEFLSNDDHQAPR